MRAPEQGQVLELFHCYDCMTMTYCALTGLTPGAFQPGKITGTCGGSDTAMEAGVALACVWVVAEVSIK